MPIISMFHGVVIRMYTLDPQHRRLPHKRLRLVQAWIELHRDALMADWALASAGQKPFRISPL